jgi:flagellar motor switch protein FliN/FliY
MPAPLDVLTQLLSRTQADALNGGGQRGWEAASTALTTILGALPSVSAVDGRLVMPEEVAGEFAEPHLAMPLEVSTDQDQTALAYLILPTAVAAAFFDSQADNPGDEEQQTIVIASTVLGQVVQAINQRVFAGSPSGLILSTDDVSANSMAGILSGMDEPALALTGTLNGAKELPFTLFLPGTFLDIVAGALPEAPAAGPEVAAAPAPAPSVVSDSLPFTLTADELAGAELLEQEPVVHRPFTTVPPTEAPVREPVAGGPPPAAHRARFAPLPERDRSASNSSIDLLAGLQMNVAVELGRTELTVADVLGLGPGSVIELDRLAGEPVDILVNDRLIARGEVVVVDENFGVRVVEVVRRSIPQEERVG